MNHSQARPIIVEALRRQGLKATPVEIYVTQSLAAFDGGYGVNWKSPPHGPEAPTSNNWGAVQYTGNGGKDFAKYRIWRGVAERTGPRVREILSIPGPPSPNPTVWFYGSDYQAPSDGGQGWFWAPYKAYPTAVDGAMHVVSLLHRMGVYPVGEATHDWISVARQLREKHYFLGYGDKEQAIRDYARNLAEKATNIASVLKEVSPLTMLTGTAGAGPLSGSASEPSQLDLPILRREARGHAVKLWQRIIGVKADGVFGSITEQTTIAWQHARGLKADGIVGVKTWELAP